MADGRDDADRAAYEATGNPLHVWHAIGRYGADEPLPEWVRRYLLRSTRELLRLMLDRDISPVEAQRQTARALGLVSQGRNRFADIRQLREDSFIATLYGLAPGKGETDAWAADLATSAKPGTKHENKVRSVRRRVAKVRRTWSR